MTLYRQYGILWQPVHQEATCPFRIALYRFHEHLRCNLSLFDGHMRAAEGMWLVVSPRKEIVAQRTTPPDARLNKSNTQLPY